MANGKNRFYGYIWFMLPALLLYTIFVIVPLILSFGYSFTNWDGYAPTFKMVGLRNYLSVFHDTKVLQTLRNTFIFGFYTPIIVTLFAIPLSLLLNSRMRTRNFQRAVFFFASVPSVLIVGYIWQFIFDSTSAGILNSILVKFGSKPVMWLSDDKWAMISVIIANSWRLIGWHACIYLANLQSIPLDYYEAASIDGANAFQQFKKITFPMLAPAMTISLLLIIIDSLKIYALPFALTGGGPGDATRFMTQLIIDIGIKERLIGKSSALSVLFFIILFVISTVQLIYSKRREERLQ